MLTELNSKDFDKYVDWAYALALNITRSAYPTYADGIKTKEDFINNSLKSFSSPNDKILLYSENNKILGWIHYYYLAEDKYVGLCAFNTEKNTKQALKEFENYCKLRYRGYTLYMGFPCKNFEAISYFKENGYILLESSYPHIFNFDRYKPFICSENIIKITVDNYSLFKKLHQEIESDMYWNSERILNSFEKWRIYYYDNGIKRGAIYFTDNELPEIFGTDFSDNKPDLDVLRELVKKCMNVCASSGADYLYYFSSDTEREILAKLGFECLSEYNLFTLCLT